jgi:Leucine-rich repeat (LRR) protein
VLSDARGSVVLPAAPGYEVLLTLPAQGGPDFAALADLEPLCIAALEVRGSPGSIVEPDVALDAAQLSCVTHLTGLRRLELGDCVLTQGALAALARLPQLRRLTVGRIEGPPDSALASLAALQTLEWLDMNLDGVSADGMAHLAALPRLHTLRMAGTKSPSLAGWAQLPRLTRLRVLDASVVDSLTDATLAYVGQLETLEELSIYNNRVEGDGLASLSQLFRLRVLRAGQTPLRSRYLAHLRALPALEEVDLRGTSVTAGGLAHLSSVPRLRRLTFYESLETSDGLEYLLQAPVLEDLDLTGSDLDDHGLTVLGQHPALRILDLNGSTGQTERGVIALARAPALRDVVVSPADMGDAGLAALACMPRLEQLSVGIYGATGGISAEGLARLGDATHLRRLHLGSHQLPTHGLRRLRHLTRLEALSLSGLPRLSTSDLAFVGALAGLRSLGLDHNDIGDAALVPIGELPALQRLNLWSAGITDAGVAHLAGLTALRELDLSRNRIGAAGLRACLPLRNLEELRLEATDIGDDALPYLAQLTKLDSVVFFHTRVTPPGSERLQRTLPNCDIYG